MSGSDTCYLREEDKGMKRVKIPVNLFHPQEKLVKFPYRIMSYPLIGVCRVLLLTS